MSAEKAIYRSEQFGETLVIEKRMANTVDICLHDWTRGLRWNRWRRTECAAYLRACKFRRTAPTSLPENLAWMAAMTRPSGASA